MRLLTLTLIVTMCFMLAGCPVSSSFPLGQWGEYKIDNLLLGTWICDLKDGEVKQISFSKKDDYVYTVKVLERGEMYATETDDFDAWITQLEGKNFLVLMEIKDKMPTQTYYVYALTSIEKEKVVTNDITLKVNGTDAITSIEAYREEVKASMKMEGFLASELVWKKK